MVKRFFKWLLCDILQAHWEDVGYVYSHKYDDLVPAKWCSLCKKREIRGE